MPIGKTLINAVLLVMLGTIIGSFGAVFLKKGSKKFSFQIKKLVKNHNLLIGILLYGLSTVPFLIALKQERLSVLYPFVSASYIWVTLLSYFYFKEKINKYKVLGIILIVLGVTLIGFGSV